MTGVILITANTGSIFENVDAGLSTWMNEIISTVQLQNSDLVAIHFQETGGKHYINGSKVVHTFFSSLVENFRTIGFNLVEGFIDSNSELECQFTALSNVYFMRDGTTGVELWDFKYENFVQIPPNETGRLFIGKELNLTNRKQKEKFPQHFYPNCKWSRKGFLRTRWRVNGTAFDLVNIHLFHDSSNLIAASAFPSIFSQNRQRALLYVLNLFKSDDLEKVPLFMFGDFNFRVNTQGIFELLKQEAASRELNQHLNGETITTNETPELILDSKRFVVPNHEEKFKYNWHWVKDYDFESKALENELMEHEISFHPTYPFDENDGIKFMKTRCPSWCDRVLFSPNSNEIISTESHLEYNLIGSEKNMGDHKPVYFSFTLKSTQESSSGNFPLLLENKKNSSTSSTDIDIISTSEIPIPMKPKCRFVAFFENLNFRSSPEPTRSRRNHHHPPTRHFSKTSSMSSNSSSTTVGSKCCFLKNPDREGDGKSFGIKQNILISNAAGGGAGTVGAGGSKLDKIDGGLVGPANHNHNHNHNEIKTSKKKKKSRSGHSKGLCPGACSIL